MSLVLVDMSTQHNARQGKLCKTDSEGIQHTMMAMKEYLQWLLVTISATRVRLVWGAPAAQRSGVTLLEFKPTSRGDDNKEELGFHGH